MSTQQLPQDPLNFYLAQQADGPLRKMLEGLIDKGIEKKMKAAAPPKQNRAKFSSNGSSAHKQFLKDVEHQTQQNTAQQAPLDYGEEGDLSDNDEEEDDDVESDDSQNKKALFQTQSKPDGILKSSGTKILESPDLMQVFNSD